MKFALLAAIVLIIAASAGIFWFTRSHPAPMAKTPTSVQKLAGTPNLHALATANSMATAQANIILTDPLDHNIHSWRTSPADVYTFKDGGYHISDNDNAAGSAAVLPTSSFEGPLSYQITMQEIKGDDGQPTNSFGMLFRFAQQAAQNSKGQPLTTFYSFEVTNTKGGEYQFWKYDNNNVDNPWTQIKDGHVAFGNEFHQGQGDQAVNTIKISMDGGKFTVTVNGTTLAKTFQDDTLTKGTVGMLVNQKGTEVAFKNMLLTHN